MKDIWKKVWLWVWMVFPKLSKEEGDVVKRGRLISVELNEDTEMTPCADPRKKLP